MRKLIPECILENYKVIFVPIPNVQKYHIADLNFETLPDINFLNIEKKSDLIYPLIFQGKGGSPLILTDNKGGNHDFFCLILIQGKRVPRKGFGDLGFAEIKKMFEVYKEFINFWLDISDKEKYSPRFCFNHDPNNTERPGLQSLERFHAHLYFFLNHNIDLNSKTNSFLLKDIINNAIYKDYYDPGSPYLEKVLLDLNRNLLKVPKKLEIIDEDIIDKVKNGRGLGLNILYNGNVEYFTQSIFIEYLVDVHLKMNEFYRNFLNSSFINIQEEGLGVLDNEKASRFIESIRWITDDTKIKILEFISHLKNLSPKIYKYVIKKKIAKNIIAYKNLCYSFSIDIVHNNPHKYIINLHPRVFSELGGAGFFSLKNYNAVILNRKKDVFFSEKDIAKRKKFQQSFINRLSSKKILENIGLSGIKCLPYSPV